MKEYKIKLTSEFMRELPEDIPNGSLIAYACSEKLKECGEVKQLLTSPEVFFEQFDNKKLVNLPYDGCEVILRRDDV